MDALVVLKDVEDFLRKDLAHVTLNSKSKNARVMLMHKVSECIKNLSEQNALDQFLAEQRETSRLASTDSDKAKSPCAVSGSEVEVDNIYVDLEMLSPSGSTQVQNQTSQDADSCGSGSGYESYDSDVPVSAKSAKDEEDLSAYFTNAEYDVFTYVYMENKTFLKGKKKRVGVVKEKQFVCYKKPTDSSPAMSFPLRAYNSTIKNKEGSSLVSLTFSTSNDSEAYKFYIDRKNVPDWAKVLKENSPSFVDATSSVPPPVAARPASTLPGAYKQTQQTSDRYGPVRRTQSIGVTDIGKGIKSAMTDMFKKDKTKKRMQTAENLSAEISGNLSVFDNKWSKKWCLVRNNQLYVYGKEERPEVQLELKGCSLLPFNDDTSQKHFGFKILKDEKEVVFMEANSAEEMGRWVGVLIAETGLVDMPESEPEYMSFDTRQSVLSSAKEAFESRKVSMREKEQEASTEQCEDIYLNMDEVSLPPPPSSNSKEIIPPRLPGRITSRTPSMPETSPVNEVAPEGSDKHSSKGEDKTEEEEDTKKDDGEVASPKSAGEQKKRKRTGKKKEKKRNLTGSDITLPTEVKQVPEIQTVEREEVRNTGREEKIKEKRIDVKADPTEVDKDERRKELAAEKADIKLKLRTLGVKKDELQKYIEAASTEKERKRLRIKLEKALEEEGELQKNDMNIQLELRKMGDIDSRANMRPPPRKEKSSNRTTASGSVFARAQMWEAANNR